MENNKQFSFLDISEYIEKVPLEDIQKLVLVGGQALNAWAEIYLHDQFHLYPFASKDLDFLATDMKVMERLAAIWNGSYIANKEICSTHAGIVTITNMQNIIQADIMSAVHGLSNNEIRKKVIKIEHDNFQCNIMHPIHCLITRLENIVGLRRRDKHSVRQLNIAIKMVHSRIISFLNEDCQREAFNEIKMIFNYLKRSKAKRQDIYNLFQIDLFDSIPCDHKLGKNYIEKHYPQMKQFLKLKGQ